MPLTKSTGNMYPWVTHMHAHLRGQCTHGCSYCYVQDFERRFNSGAFKGPIRLKTEELSVNYGEGKTIFIEHKNDLFAYSVAHDFIREILTHCCLWPNNVYVFQTKNPLRLAHFFADRLPVNCLVGTTMESNRFIPEIMGNSPCPAERHIAMLYLRMHYPKIRRFVTIEPILDFDPFVMVDSMNEIAPEFVNIGADSKGHNLPEPSRDKIEELISGLQKAGIQIREKHNLERLMKGETK